MMLILKQGLSGRGVFADQPIPRGSHVITYTGPLLRYDQTTPQTLAVQIGKDAYLGASGGYDDYVNHSCDPNCGLVIEPAGVNLIAIRDIAAGEELFFDYSTTMDENDFEMPCRCGIPSCRRVIRDFKHLPRSLQQHYVQLGIVPDYNRKYLE